MFTVNFGSRTPVYQQLYDDVVRLTSLGILKSHTKLPPVRTLATELGINPNTVQKAYKIYIFNCRQGKLYFRQIRTK